MTDEDKATEVGCSPLYSIKGRMFFFDELRFKTALEATSFGFETAPLYALIGIRYFNDSLTLYDYTNDWERGLVRFEGEDEVVVFLPDDEDDEEASNE